MRGRLRRRPDEGRPAMRQYLLAVHMIEGEPIPPEEEIQKRYKAVDAFNAEVQSAGAWVFAGGLHPPETATVVRSQNGQVVTTDGPFAETKEQLGGFWVIKAPDLDAALAWAAKGSEACGAPVEVRPRMPPPSSAPTGKARGAPWPPWLASSATSTSPRTRSRRLSPWPHSAGPPRACRPTPAAGSSPRPAIKPW